MQANCHLSATLAFREGEEQRTSPLSQIWNTEKKRKISPSLRLAERAGEGGPLAGLSSDPPLVVFARAA